MSEDSNIIINESTPDTAYFSVSLSKLRNMYLLTFGLYSIYWFYQHWKLQDTYSAPSVSPIFRAIFSIFFTHSLASRIKQSMENKNIAGSNSLGLLATAFVALILLVNIISRIPDSSEYQLHLSFAWLILIYLSVLPLIEFQDKVNELKGDPMGSVNSTYNWQNIVIMIIGCVLWSLVILGIIAASLGLAE